MLDENRILSKCSIYRTRLTSMKLFLNIKRWDWKISDLKIKIVYDDLIVLYLKLFVIGIYKLHKVYSRCG